MTQQAFAEFTQIGAATLSSIFNGRTRPTLNTVECIKRKIPDINTDWLVFGRGDMYVSHPSGSSPVADEHRDPISEPTLNFEQPQPAAPPRSVAVPQQVTAIRVSQPELPHEEIKTAERPKKRKVVSLMVFYDDDTVETFVPSKSK